MKDFEFTLELNGEKTEINTIPLLSMADTLAFISSVVDTVAGVNSEDVNLGLKDFIIKINAVEYFTDCPIPESVEDQFDLVYNTNIYEKIVEHVNKEYYPALIQNINKQIDFELNRLAHKSKVDELVDTINGIVKKIDDGLDVKKISAALEKLQGMEKIDEKALVKAFINEKKPGRKKKVAE